MKLNTNENRQELKVTRDLPGVQNSNGSEQRGVRRLRSVLGVCIVATVCVLLFPACPGETGRIPGQDPMIEFVDGVTVPLPVDYNQLAAAYFSPEGRAMISVFPGTTIPTNGLTVDVVDPTSLAAPLAAMNPEFALEMGPSGSTFNEPVRVSTVIGKTITNDEGETILPFVDVYTMNNGQPELIEDVGMEIDEDGLITTHALMPHFSPAAFRILGGVKIKVNSPVKNPLSWVGGKISSKLTATNITNDDNYTIFVESKTVIRGKLKNKKFQDESYYLDKGKSASVGVGTCECSGVGKGQIKTTLKVTKYNKKKNTFLTLIKSRVVTVTCIEMNLQMEVYGDLEEHYTDYRVRGEIGEIGEPKRDLLHPDMTKHIKVEWDFKGIKCGKAEQSLKYGAFWGHYMEDPKKEELSKIKCKVTYTDDKGRTITRVYDAPARANEGKKVPF